jgi:hypothetical protein
MNFIIEGDFVAKLDRLGKVYDATAEKLMEVTFDVAKEWMEEVKEELADKFAELMMEGFEEREVQDKEKEEAAHESMGGEGKHEGGAEGKHEGMSEHEGGGGIFSNPLAHSGFMPNDTPEVQELFHILESEKSREVSLAYEPSLRPWQTTMGLMSNKGDWEDKSKIYNSIAMARMGQAIGMGASMFGAITGEATEGGDESGNEITLMHNDVIFVSQALHRATNYAIALKEQHLEHTINRECTKELRKILAEHGF